MASRGRAAAGKLGLLLGATVFALLVAELAVRVLHLGPKRFPPLAHLENGDKSAGVDVYPTNPRGSFDVDLNDATQRAALEARGIPGLADAAKRTPYGVSFSYDAERCRDRAFGPKTPGVKRIIVLGDSFTEGQGVREQDTFVRRIERAWLGEPSASRAELYNCGRRGRDFPALREAFDALLAQEPDVVLYAMVLNDPAQSKGFHDRQEFLNDWIVDRRRTTQDDGSDVTVHGSALWGLVREKAESARVARATTDWYRDLYAEPNRDGWEATQRDLAAMNEAMRSRGGVFAIAVLPLMVGFEDAYPFAGPHAAIAAACTKLGLHCHDVLPAFQGRKTADLWVHAVDLHPNENAHAVIADDVGPWLKML